MTNLEVEELTKTIEAFSTCHASIESILQLASAKQKQRAEPWQQTVIDLCNRALRECDRIMKDII